MSAQEPNVGEYLKQIRLERGLSLRQAASLIGVAHSRVDEVERMIDGRSNKPFVPSYGLLLKFARGYGLSPLDLLRRAGHMPGAEFSADEWKLIEGYRAMPEERRAQLRETLAAWQES